MSPEHSNFLLALSILGPGVVILVVAVISRWWGLRIQLKKSQRRL